MSVIFLLLIVSVSVASMFLAAFLWSVKSGQFDDQVSPPLRMLFDNPPVAKENSTPSKTANQNSKP
jgi:cbb3-type cytochrome oxidase maturation protein